MSSNDSCSTTQHSTIQLYCDVVRLGVIWFNTIQKNMMLSSEYVPLPPPCNWDEPAWEWTSFEIPLALWQERHSDYFEITRDLKRISHWPQWRYERGRACMHLNSFEWRNQSEYKYRASTNNYINKLEFTEANMVELMHHILISSHAVSFAHFQFIYLFIYQSGPSHSVCRCKSVNLIPSLVSMMADVLQWLSCIIGKI